MKLSDDFKKGVAYAKSYVLVENIGGIEYVAAALGDAAYLKFVAAKEAIEELHRVLVKEVGRLAREGDSDAEH